MYVLSCKNEINEKNSLKGHLLTLTLTLDDLESHIVMNVSSTSNIIPSFMDTCKKFVTFHKFQHI